MGKKILFIADGCHPETQGGIQTLGRTLQKIFGKNFMFVAYKMKSLRIFKVLNVKEIGTTNLIFRIVNKILRNKLREILTKNYIKQLKPEICILRSPQNLKLLKKIKCKKILIQHTRLDRYYSDKSYYNSEYKLFEISKKELDYFVVTSKQDKIILTKKYKFPLEKIKVIRHCCEINLRKTKKDKNRNLIMIGRLDNKSKRFDLPIKAMKKLKNFRLNIYGAGPDKLFLENLIIKENLKNVFLCGATNKVKEKLDRSGIFVMSSDYESYGIVNIEAMRRGLPIIIRNTFDAVPDIVNDNGIILKKEWNEEEFVKKINEIYNNYQYYSSNSLKKGRNYNFDIIKEQWEELFIK